MYASLTRVTAKLGQVDAAVTAWRTARQEDQPVQAIEGLRHTYVLVDRPRGEIVIVGLWDTEAAARAYETSAEAERVRRGLGPPRRRRGPGRPPALRGGRGPRGPLTRPPGRPLNRRRQVPTPALVRFVALRADHRRHESSPPSWGQCRCPSPARHELPSSRSRRAPPGPRGRRGAGARGGNDGGGARLPTPRAGGRRCG